MMTLTKESACFFTQQVFLIGTKDEDGKDHFAPISWISYTWGWPACLVISMAGVKQTKKNIERTGQLTAAILTEDLIPFAEQCNLDTYREELAEKVKVQTIPGTCVDAPLIENAVFSYECKLLHKVDIGECTTYFAEIKAVHASEEVRNLDFLDIRKIRPVIYSDYRYFLPGEYLGEIGDYSRE